LESVRLSVFASRAFGRVSGVSEIREIGKPVWVIPALRDLPDGLIVCVWPALLFDLSRFALPYHTLPPGFVALFL